MLNQRFLTFLLSLPLIFSLSCSHTGLAQKEESNSPLKLLISDGSVRVEESYKNKMLRQTAALMFQQAQFESQKFKLSGQAGVEESSEFELESTPVECRITTGRKKLKRTPATSQGDDFIYKLQVQVSDGIKGGPFESVINGENEGLIQFGEYPVNSWQSTDNLILNDTMITSWFYEPAKKRYEIVKKMGEDRFLKKLIRFDPNLEKITHVRYEILHGPMELVDQQMTVLAWLDCRS